MPRPTMRNRTSTVETPGTRPVTVCAANQPTTVAPMMTTPPIVGVPRFV